MLSYMPLHSTAPGASFSRLWAASGHAIARRFGIFEGSGRATPCTDHPRSVDIIRQRVSILAHQGRGEQPEIFLEGATTIADECSKERRVSLRRPVNQPQKGRRKGLSRVEDFVLYGVIGVGVVAAVALSAVFTTIESNLLVKWLGFAAMTALVFRRRDSH